MHVSKEGLPWADQAEAVFLAEALEAFPAADVPSVVFPAVEVVAQVIAVLEISAAAIMALAGFLKVFLLALCSTLQGEARARMAKGAQVAAPNIKGQHLLPTIAQTTVVAV